MTKSFDITYLFSPMKIFVFLAVLLALVLKIHWQAPEDNFSEKAARVMSSGSNDDKFKFALAIPNDQKLTKIDIKLFEDSLGMNSYRVQVLLCNAILRSDSENQLAIQRLMILAKTEEEWVRVQAACAMQFAHPSKAAVECANVLINDASATVRAQILISLSQNRNDFNSLGKDLVKAMRQEKDLEVMIWCFNAIARINPKVTKEDVDIIYRYLNSHSPHVRRAAVRAIQKVDCQSERTAKQLILMLSSDPDEDVRQIVADGFCTTILDTADVNSLVECLRKEKSKLTKAYIIRFLGTQKSVGPAGIEELMRLCEDDYFEPDAVMSLGTIGREKADVQKFLEKRLTLAIARGDRKIVEIIQKAQEKKKVPGNDRR